MCAYSTAVHINDPQLLQIWIQSYYMTLEGLISTSDETGRRQGAVFYKRNHWKRSHHLHHCCQENCKSSDLKSLKRTVKSDESFIETQLSSIHDIYTKRCMTRATRNIKDRCHGLFTLLLSGKMNIWPKIIQTLQQWASALRLSDSFTPCCPKAQHNKQRPMTRRYLLWHIFEGFLADTF